MRIGITGGAGYIAAHVVHDLLEQGHQIITLDNLATGNKENIVENNKLYEFIEGDIEDPAALKLFFSRNLDVIYHFAASKAAGESMTDPQEYSKNNIRNTFNLIEQMLVHNCRYIIFSSSAAVYGLPQYLPVDENHPICPENYYGFTKKVIEENLQWFSRLKGIRYAALRYFNAAGYDIRGRVTGLEIKPNNLLPVIMEVAVGWRKELEVFGTDYETKDGTCIRDYIHINDLSIAHIEAMTYIMKENHDLTVNLGSETGFSVFEVLKTARRITGKEIPHRDVKRRFGDPPELISSSKKINALLNWKAKYSDVEQLIESMWRVYKMKI